jgi:hypothetical protein
MGLEVGTINPKVFLLLGVIAVGAGGYMWYTKMYQPAVADKTTAQAARDSAQQTLTADQTKLKTMQDTNHRNAQPHSDDRLEGAKIQALFVAVPRDANEIEPMMQIEQLAKKSGVSLQPITIGSPSGGSSVPTPEGASTSGPTGLQAQTLDVTGFASYDELALFTRSIQNTVFTFNGQLYVHTRLLGIPNIKMDDGANASNSGGDAGDGAGNFSAGGYTGTGPTVPKGKIHFDMTVDFFSAPAAPSAPSSGDASAAGSTSTTPGAAGGATTPAGGTPGTTGTTTPTGGAGAPAGGTAPTSGTPGAPAGGTAPASGSTTTSTQSTPAGNG